MIDLEAVVTELSWLKPEPIYVGGAVVPLFLDEFGRSQMRPTEDVDCIVPQVITRKEWWDLEEQLRRRRWSPDPNGPLCRYRSPAGAIVDLMPAHPNILGFSGRWYPRIVEQAQRYELSGGHTLLIPSPSLLFASKLEAFGDRGSKDPWMSKDLEDIAALLDGCAELLTNVQAQQNDLQLFIAEQLSTTRPWAAATKAARETSSGSGRSKTTGEGGESTHLFTNNSCFQFVNMPYL